MSMSVPTIEWCDGLRYSPAIESAPPEMVKSAVSGVAFHLRLPLLISPRTTLFSKPSIYDFGRGVDPAALY
jgi:hypothetical protein